MKSKWKNHLVEIARSFLAVRYGYRLIDKFRIFLTRLLYPCSLFCLKVSASCKTSFAIPSTVMLHAYCRNQYGIFKVPANAELQFLPSFEPAVKEKISSFKEGVFVDIGANIGLYTVMMSKILGNRGKVISIEPHPKYFGVLVDNVKSNNCNNVTPISVACWSGSGRMQLYESAFGSGHSLVTKTRRYWTVQVRRLDDIVEENDHKKIKVIKIDVENAEVHVLKGMTGLLVNGNPAVIFESSPKMIGSAEKILRELGYGISRLRDGNYVAEKY